MLGDFLPDGSTHPSTGTSTLESTEMQNKIAVVLTPESVEKSRRIAFCIPKKNGLFMSSWNKESTSPMLSLVMRSTLLNRMTTTSSKEPKTLAMKMKAERVTYKVPCIIARLNLHQQLKEAIKKASPINMVGFKVENKNGLVTSLPSKMEDQLANCPRKESRMGARPKSDCEMNCCISWGKSKLFASINRIHQLELDCRSCESFLDRPLAKRDGEEPPASSGNTGGADWETFK